jgi:LysR family transcriptional regulator, glycine cleavage system transcriptional activator
MPTNSPALRLPSIDALRAFEAAARLGSFERAAEELAVTASAISKRVALLEDLLGTSVFVRGGKTLALTASGTSYLDSIAPVLEALTQMPQHQVAHPHLHARQQRQSLRVCTPPTFARQVLVPHLEGFTALHPDIELEVVLSIPSLPLQEFEADLHVRHLPTQGAAAPVLMHDRVLPMAAPSLLQRLPAMATPADLAQAPLLCTPLEPWAPWFKAARLNWPEPDSGVKLLDLGMNLEAAVSGLGVALARPSLARHWLQTGLLVPLFGIGATPARQYHLLPHTLPNKDAAQHFARWLVGVCQSLQHESHALISWSA